MAKNQNEETDDTAVTEGSTDDALADAEGRDRSDSNELVSHSDVVSANAIPNQSDAALRGAFTPPPADEFGAEPTPAPKLTDKEKTRRDRFAKLAKIDVDDILSFNANTGVGVTSNGGKYQMNRRGTQLRHLAGPVPVDLISAKEEADQERLEREANAQAEAGE